MTKIVKGQWYTDGDSVHLSLPFAKVDREKRTVSGWATMDNTDKQGDIVLAEASARAFARARGNLREMHAPVAVGKVVDFEEESFYDPEGNNGKGAFYRGIFVTARVSEGAQDTWLKVLDGTLTGFSIGGEITKSDDQFIPDENRSVRIIKDYDLVELSLVDNPANPLANILSFQKSANGSVTVKGIAVDTHIENVFFCTEDGVARVSEEEALSCVECGNKMENIGWFESGEDKEEKVRDICNKFLTPDSTNEGGVNMGKKRDKTDDNVEVTKSEESVEETPETTETTNDVEEVSEETDSTDVEEVADESEELAKRIDDLKETLQETVNTTFEKTRDETNEAVQALEERITELNSAFEKKTAEFEEKLNELDEGFRTAKGRLSSFEKTLNSYSRSGAVRKSSELDSEEPIEKSDNLWNGAFSADSL